MRIKAGILFFTLLCAAFLPLAAGAAELPVNERNITVLKEVLLEAEKEIEAEPDNTEALKCAGIAAHQLALFEGKGYSEKALEYLGKVSKKEPENIVLMAYLGSSYALSGRDGTVVMARVSSVNKGVSLLNKAVKKAPNDFIVRMIRASVFFELPPMFKKAEAAYEDFQFLESRFSGMPTLEPDLKAEVYYKLGFLAGEQDKKELKELYFSKAVEASPDSKWAGLAK